MDSCSQSAWPAQVVQVPWNLMPARSVVSLSVEGTAVLDPLTHPQEPSRAFLTCLRQALFLAMMGGSMTLDGLLVECQASHQRTHPTTHRPLVNRVSSVANSGKPAKVQRGLLSPSALPLTSGLACRHRLEPLAQLFQSLPSTMLSSCHRSHHLPHSILSAPILLFFERI